MQFYSQLKQDVWVVGLFPAPGFFVDVGAGDGVLNSNSKALEELGWNGICVEPGCEATALRQRRLCAVDTRCIWRECGEVDFKEVDRCWHWLGIPQSFCDAYDRSGGKLYKKQAITLTTLLEEHAAPTVIEYLSLDTEGSEYEILQGHDFAKYRFKAITVEHNFSEPKRAQIRELLIAAGYVLDTSRDYEDWDDWYRLAEST